MERLKFTRDHLWVRVDGSHAKIGLSDYGQASLGELLALQLPEIGDPVERGEAFGEIESSATVSDLVAPVSGTVTAINTDLEDHPTLVNDDPHEEGWLVEVDVSDESELDDLLEATDYDDLIAESD